MIKSDKIKSSKNFHCSYCDYNTSRLSQYNRHIQTQKHKMIINGNPNLSSYRKKITVKGIYDHRILMSAAIISLITGIKSKLSNFEQVSTSCPNFLYTIKKLGGRFEKKN